MSNAMTAFEMLPFGGGMGTELEELEPASARRRQAGAAPPGRSPATGRREWSGGPRSHHISRLAGPAQGARLRGFPPPGAAPPSVSTAKRIRHRRAGGVGGAGR